MVLHFTFETAPYIPHITIAATKDVQHAKRLCDDLNQRGVQVPGTVDALTVGALGRSRFEAIRRFALIG